MTALDASIRFFLELAFILGVCRVTGWVFRRLGQSQVVSEMIAGVLMGPSLFGWVAPAWHAYVFPPETKAIIFGASQVGLALYMFLVGLDFQVGLVRARARSAISVSAAGIIAP
ncbi:MAG TPA: cation:proton antiporter, partial [Planctomycetota bacterium]|nr:cation:proton antiporter [Planctomycetota bacterium]